MNTETIFLSSMFFILIFIRIWSKRKWIKEQIKILLTLAQAQGGFYNGERIKYRLEKTSKK